MLLSEIAKKLNAELVGEDVEILNFTSLDMPKDKSLSILNSKKMISFIDNPNVVAVVTTKKFQQYVNKPVVIVDEIKSAMIVLLDLFYPTQEHVGQVSDRAFVSKSANLGDNIVVEPFSVIKDRVKIGKNAYIGANVIIGEDVEIGENTKIYPNVVIYEGCKIGDNVTIHSGAIIGADGFGYLNTPKGHIKIRQVGNVVIEDNVEIGANTTIDRGALSSTVIGEGTKIDNLVQIGHNVKIGKHCIIVSQTGIAGSTTIGNFVVIGGQVGIADHVNISDGVMLASKSGVMSDITEPGVYSGVPLVEHRKWLKNQSALKDIANTLKQIDKFLKG
ncbi:MAG: UDP-3-O-(3-hydroxymyristoyl)glucosamine N-acyltransferase [Deferribacterales bacterium]|jgi:UDP-3-O-[3-hydroxymyristoyl] glucosamine N-acyltransferase|uniref:UDP-3-O-(3-hydroxymyristoyl)glucosamine N-acyltransferase n=1 Tax=Deferrivibrio essentukiensis TaxID=2880922 RepID=UPI001989BDD9|nr:UDP-3-O-(3-hydroxymyristoyl)glucosamine N-acyltransferase [Deferrivibrio essentukiensis]MBC7195704.1 UDP-3-O-(3-hydroxymyristoyl)glucosamine N-acyltransferase [Deferribacterales bacterium]MCB4203729.1 UDP-3-O-(3-hydroxymyristoyl)glucosamine N-acyltransferase [Deferrivibrio essentukiensis]